ncbi:MAG: ABC transporter permease [Burkholderiales bacterium]|nr:ABC transporter permease [Burkholderiales bacterium]
MKSRVAAIARFTLLEALRTRLAAITLLVFALLAAAGFFVEGIAIAESERFGAGFYAATARWAAVFLVAFHVLAAIAREFDDKGLEVLLALDAPRAQYVIGRLAGFITVAALVAAAACVPLALHAPPVALAQWGFSLGCELAIIAALALFCAVSFNHIVPAAGFVVAFYLLARSLGAMRLMSAHPLAGADTFSHQAISLMVEGLALVVPALADWTRTEWLVNQPAAATELAAIAAQGALYVALLAAAAMFDLYRKNF